jgi:hypothetical protein
VSSAASVLAVACDYQHMLCIAICDGRHRPKRGIGWQRRDADVEAVDACELRERADDVADHSQRKLNRDLWVYCERVTRIVARYCCAGIGSGVCRCGSSSTNVKV